MSKEVDGIRSFESTPERDSTLNRSSSSLFQVDELPMRGLPGSLGLFGVRGTFCCRFSCFLAAAIAAVKIIGGVNKPCFVNVTLRARLLVDCGPMQGMVFRRALVYFTSASIRGVRNATAPFWYGYVYWGDWARKPTRASVGCFVLVGVQINRV
jgi:hypothetical protein